MIRSVRCCATREQSLNYLKQWVGSGENPRIASLRGQKQQSINRLQQGEEAQNLPLTITANTFLLPTLQIPRFSTPSSLDTSIKSALAGHTPGRTLISGGNGNNTSGGVPVILDLSLKSHDGSHHYTPPSASELHSITSTLSNYGIIPCGIAKTGGNVASFAESMQLPMVQMGGKGKEGWEIGEVCDFVVSSAGEGAVSAPATSSPPEPMPETNAVEDDNDSSLKELEKKLREVESERDGLLEIQQQIAAEAAMPPPIAEPQEQKPTKFYRGHVRSGQQVSSSGGPLVIFGSVHSGGEVLSDSDIHVYGKLKGRALAGLSVPNSRIYAQEFDAELVCIGGVFTTLEDGGVGVGLKGGAGAMIFLEEGEEGEDELTFINLK